MSLRCATMEDVGTPELLLIGLMFAVVCGTIAHRKGRNTAGWAFLGFVSGPLPLLIVMLLKSHKTPNPSTGSAESR